MKSNIALNVFKTYLAASCDEISIVDPYPIATVIGIEVTCNNII